MAPRGGGSFTRKSNLPVATNLTGSTFPCAPFLRVTEHSDENGMTASALGAIFAPLILKASGSSQEPDHEKWAAVAGALIVVCHDLSIFSNYGRL